MSNCDRNTLLQNAACFADMPIQQQNAIMIQLLCNIAGNNATPQLIYDGGTVNPAGWSAIFGTITYDANKVYMSGPVTSMDTQHDNLLDGTLDVSAFAPTLKRLYAYGNENLQIINYNDLTNLENFVVGYILKSEWDLTNLTNLLEYDPSFNTSLTTVDLSPVPNLKILTLTSCTSLSTVDITPCPALEQFYAIDCNLTLNTINSVLMTLDANGVENGTLRATGGTTPIPTGAGLTAKANLLAKGWVCETNN